MAEKGAVNTGFLAPARLMPITATTGPQTSGGGLTASVAYFRSSSFYSGGSNVSVGGCVIPYSHLAATSLAVGPLDADSLMTLTGPSGPITLVPDLSSAPSGTRYNLPSVAASGPIPAAGGVFTFDNGVGGNGVSHFSASVTIPPAFTLTSYTAQFSHSAGGLVTWTGSGGPDTFVAITGASPLGFSIFFCTAPLSAGQFAIPAFVSQAMMPGNGSLSVGIYSKSKLFTAPGLDLGLSNAGTVIQILNASFN